jgi:uncharacterized protein (TIGR02453 family)
MGSFAGFPGGLLLFLEELSANNNRDWFSDNKQRYEDLVRNPALDFIGQMGPHLTRLSSRFEAIPKRSGGSLMRVYRDTRFARDKTPYKTNVGIQFRHMMARDIHAPGFYVHIEPHEVFVGVGSWRPDSMSLAKIRARIAEKPELWRVVERKKNFKRYYEFVGDSLIRPPRGFDREHPLIETLKRKDFIAIHRFDERDIESNEFFDTVLKRFRNGLPLMAFLCRALELPF